MKQVRPSSRPFTLLFPRHPRGLKPALDEGEATTPTTHDACTGVSQFTSQWDDLKKEIRENARAHVELVRR
jgi:hypothetical protein